MLTKLYRQVDKLSENFNKDIKITKKKKRPIRTEEYNNSMKNTLEGINIRSDNSEEWVVIKKTG